MRRPGKLLFALYVTWAAAFAVEQNVTLSSQDVFVGEPVRITYAFADDSVSDRGDLRFTPPPLAHMQVLESRVDGGRGLWQAQIVAVPLRSGMLAAGEASISAAKMEDRQNAWGQWMPHIVWQTFPFAPATLNVFPLPAGIEAVGGFRMEAAVDREQIQAGEPVTLTLSLAGCGNLEPAPPPRLEIPGVDVFEGEYKRNALWREGCYYNETNRTYTLVGTDDFTIPSVTLHTFDPALKAVVPVRTLPIDVRVRHGAETRDSKSEEETMTMESIAAAGAVGFGFGVAVTLLWLRREKRVKRTRPDPLRKLLVALFEHLDDPDARQSAEAVEKHLYEGADAPDDAAISILLSRLKRPSDRS